MAKYANTNLLCYTMNAWPSVNPEEQSRITNALALFLSKVSKTIPSEPLFVSAHDYPVCKNSNEEYNIANNLFSFRYPSLFVDIESASATVLYFLSPEENDINCENFHYLSEDTILTKEQAFMRTLPLLEHYSLPTSLFHYDIFLNPYQSHHTSYGQKRSVYYQIESNTTLMDKYPGTIRISVAAFSGNIIGAWYSPSSATLELWCEMTMKRLKKETSNEI